MPAIRINPPGSPIAIDPTQDGVVRCRYDLFVRLNTWAQSHFPKNSRTWTYRGDRFTTVENEMIRKLVQCAIKIKKGGLYKLFELYDNTYPKDQEGRIVLKVLDNQVEINRVPLYINERIITNLPLPDYLKEFK